MRSNAATSGWTSDASVAPASTTSASPAAMSRDAGDNRVDARGAGGGVVDDGPGDAELARHHDARASKARRVPRTPAGTGSPSQKAR